MLRIVDDVTELDGATILECDFCEIVTGDVVERQGYTWTGGLLLCEVCNARFQERFSDPAW